MPNSTLNLSSSSSADGGVTSPAWRAVAASHGLLTTYALLCVCGVAANGTVICALASSKKRYVSDAYVLNLAVADLLFLLGMPFLAHQLVSEQRWRFGSFMCKALTLVDVNNQYTSVGTVTVLCIDRYVAVAHPLTAAGGRSVHGAFVTNAAVWLCSLLLSLPAPVYARVLSIHGVEVCALDFPDPRRGATAYAVANFVLAFAAPLGLISVFYALTLGRVSGAMRRARLRRQSARSRRVTRTAVAIVVAFAACWTPFHVLQMVGLTLSEPTGAFHLASQLSICLGYAHSCINPVLLIFFTDFFKERLPCRRRCRPRSCRGCWGCWQGGAADGSGKAPARAAVRRSAWCGDGEAPDDDEGGDADGAGRVRRERDAGLEDAAATVMTTAAEPAAGGGVGGGAGGSEVVVEQAKVEHTGVDVSAACGSRPDRGGGGAVPPQQCIENGSR